MSSANDQQTRAAVDRLLERAGLQVASEEYARLLTIYPLVESQRAEMALVDTPDVEPAMVFRAGE